MIITVSHQKGGVGKSTISWNLAVYLANKKKVTVIDLDVQKTLTYLHKIRNKNDFNIISFESEKSLIEFVNSHDENSQEIIIIDSGGFDSSMNRLAILGADKLITPVSSKFIEILGLQTYENILSEIEQTNETEIKTNVILNNINPNVKNFTDISNFINKSKHFNLMKNVLRQRADISNSVANGLGITEVKSNEKAIKEFIKFVEELSI
ncbi:MAG TPA: ParA family protein [Arcobacter sp.]|nr:ParA family protein [Arcobacter sp.]